MVIKDEDFPKTVTAFTEMIHKDGINSGAAVTTLNSIETTTLFDIGGDWIKIPCKDGSICLVLKNISKAFSIYGREWDSKFKIVLDILDKIKFDGDIEVKTKVVKLFENLNYVNAEIREMYQNSYLTFAGNPCSESAQKEKQRMDSVITTLAMRLIALKVILDAGGANANTIDKAADMLAMMLGDVKPKEA